MLYHAYQAYADTLLPFRMFAEGMARFAGRPWPGFDPLLVQRNTAAAWTMLAETRLTHRRPPFAIDEAEERVVRETPFCRLVHFATEGEARRPRVLMVAPMSGHFATLLRHTIRTMLPEHDVYVTDWVNARDVPLAAGRFGFDEFIAHVIDFIAFLGPGTHVLGVCQPAVAVLAAVALMAAEGHPAQPPSMTLMAGPIDTRINPTRVDELAVSRPIEWFEANLISRVPMCHAGALRRVYPGFVQLAAFMAMNSGRHARAFGRYFAALVDGDAAGLAAHHAFYDEYFAVMDLPAEFYLETVEKVFQRHELARGTLVWRGRKVEPGAIRNTALLTVEGERDDICAVGQTRAAQDLCGGLAARKRRHHFQAGVGHYGVFSGRRWAGEVYPRVRETIASSD
jgi:polyhydroxyalkanoate depolymerase